MGNVIARLAQAIGYPEEIPAESRVCVFKVDGQDVEVVEEVGRLVFTRVLSTDPDEAALSRLAGYAAGRILKEEAVLAWDPSRSALILWQGVSASASDTVLRRVFEVFATSCDWWVARVRDDEAVSSIPPMMIRP